VVEARPPCFIAEIGEAEELASAIEVDSGND
jgi:hypothetical protein